MVAPTVSAGKIVLFRYSETRRAEEAVELYGDSNAALMSDGYGGYDCLVKANPTVSHLACWAHARRYFIDAQKAQPKGKQGKADHVVSQIRKLYRIEAETEPGSHQRFWRRSRESRLILDELRQWLDKGLENPIKQNALGKTLTYLHNQWSKLVRYLENADWPIDNNPAENAVRPFVVGRKNWLFATSPKGAHASARLYSLIETAKAHGLEPERYMETVLTRLPQAKELKDIEAILPWAISAEKEVQKQGE